MTKFGINSCHVVVKPVEMKVTIVQSHKAQASTYLQKNTLRITKFIKKKNQKFSTCNLLLFVSNFLKLLLTYLYCKLV